MLDNQCHLFEANELKQLYQIEPFADVSLRMPKVRFVPQCGHRYNTQLRSGSSPLCRMLQRARMTASSIHMKAPGLIPPNLIWVGSRFDWRNSNERSTLAGNDRCGRTCTLRRADANNQNVACVTPQRFQPSAGPLPSPETPTGDMRTL
jgi:hypothetical protein